MTRPLVSVVIPCFNYAHYLGAAIDSAFDQTHQPVEVIVVDDGSTDGTPDVARRYGDRITFLRKPNGGPGSARNLGVEHARGKYIAFLDADDVFDPKFVAETLAVFERSSDPRLEFVYTQLKYFGREEHTTNYPDFDLAALKWGNFIPVQALVHRRVFDRGHRFYEPLRGDWEDWDLYLDIGRAGGVGQLLDKPLVYYRRHKDSVSDRLSVDTEEQRRLGLIIFLRHRWLYSRWFIFKQQVRDAIIRVSRRIRGGSPR